MTLAENIRFSREKIGMYQSDLGKALGVSAQAISKWELGKAEPDRESILKMCELFDVSADELLGRDPGTKKEAAPLGGLEEALREKYRQLTPDQQKQADLYLDFLIASQDKKDT